MLGKFLVMMCAWILPVLSAQASPWQWSAALGGDVRWFDWREHQNAKQLLMEYGPMYSGLAEVRVQYAQAYTGFNLGLGGGLAHYDGHLQSGSPYEADAWEQISDAEWQFGWQGEKADLHAGLMNRYWHRLIEGTGNVSSAEEAYNWRLLMMGGGGEIFRAGRWKVGVTADVGIPVDSRQRVYSDEFGDFVLEPGDGSFFRVAMPWQRGSLLLRPYYQQQNMDRSASVTLLARSNGQYYRLYQPESVRRELGVSLLWYLGGRARGFPGSAE